MESAFKEFMKDDGFTKGSIASYNSYINGTFKNFSGRTGHNYDTIYARLQTYTKTSRIRYCEYLISLLNAEIADPYSQHNKKTLKNYKAGMMEIKSFLASGIYTQGGAYSFNKKFSFSYSDLIENFAWRLETQDRIYPRIKCCFPCRLFGIIYKKNSSYIAMREQSLCQTKFLINANRDYIVLKEVDRLTISYGAKALVNQTEYSVFTDTIKQGAYLGCAEAKVKLLEALTLDHDEPLENIVAREITKTPELKKLSDAYWCCYQTSGLTGNALTTFFYKNEYKKLGIDEARLLDEIVKIYQYVKLTIMDGSSNSSRSNNSTIVIPPLGAHLT